MEGVSLQWYDKLFANDSILEAFQTSILLALGCSLTATILGVMAAIALVRYQFKGKNAISTLISMPLLIPEVVLGVALLMFLKLVGVYRSFGMLLLGHTVLALPFVVLVVQARLVGLRQNFEEAALSLGAGVGDVLDVVQVPAFNDVPERVALTVRFEPRIDCRAERRVLPAHGHCQVGSRPDGHVLVHLEGRKHPCPELSKVIVHDDDGHEPPVDHLEQVVVFEHLGCGRDDDRRPAAGGQVSVQAFEAFEVAAAPPDEHRLS